MVWYSSGNFDSMWVIVSESSICTLNFRRSPLSSSSSVINYSGFLVMSSSLHLRNFLRSLVLEAPLVGSTFLESFIHACLASPYLLAFVFASSTIWKKTRVFLCECQFIVNLHRWLNLVQKILLLLFHLRHLPLFSYHLFAGHCIPWFQLLPWFTQLHSPFFSFTHKGGSLDSIFVHILISCIFLSDFFPKFQSSRSTSKYVERLQ